MRSSVYLLTLFLLNRYNYNCANTQNSNSGEYDPPREITAIVGSRNMHTSDRHHPLSKRLHSHTYPIWVPHILVLLLPKGSTLTTALH